MASATTQTPIVSAADSTDEYGCRDPMRSRSLTANWGFAASGRQGDANLLCPEEGASIGMKPPPYAYVRPDLGSLLIIVYGAMQQPVGIKPEPDAATLSPEPPDDPLVEYIKNNLAEIDTSDLDDEDMPPTREAKDACVRLAYQLVDSLRNDPTLRVAAFVGENGGVSLVAQSIDADRRISIDIVADGRAAEVATVDENAQVATSRTEIDNTGRFRELACWLIEPILRKRQAIAGTFAD